MDGQDSKSVSISSTNFDEFNTKLQGAALKATRNALAIPADVAFHRSVDPQLARDLDTLSSRVLSLTNDILGFVSATDGSKSIRNKRKSKVNDLADVVDNFTSIVVDPVDLLLERVDTCLDDFLGRRALPAIAINPPGTIHISKKQTLPQGWLDPALKHASHLPKPQLSFKRKPDNSSDLHWYPSLSHKYNAQVPLGYDLRDEAMESDAEQLQNNHPYRYEIKHIEYPTWMFLPTQPIPPKSFDQTPFTWVATHNEFSAMLDTLRNAREIAVDLEHHSYRTFSGFLCLMQISTREQDWVVDALVLREELTELNEVFTNPNIVKVFHGAKSDVLWLQQDFSIYLVNLFDTFHASKVLDFPRHGLANLLEMYCDFTPDKRYQLADWRIRPLPKEMMLYARSDTHFLLYIYDNLRNALLDLGRSHAEALQTSQSHESPTSTQPTSKPIVRDQSHAPIWEVLARSEETALSTYKPQSYDAERGVGLGGWESLLRKWNKSALIEGAQRNLFLSVHAWRDRVAREEDESIRYVLPDHCLLQLIEQPPSDMASLNRMFHSVPPIVRKRARELLNIIQENVRPSNESSPIPTPDVEAIASSEDTALGQAVEKARSNANMDALWSKDSIMATKSSLFGSTLTSAPSKSSGYSISESTLFGGMASSKAVMTPSSSNGSHFRDVVARIHSALVVAPCAPKASQREITDAETDAAAPTDEPEEPTENEIPFVPAALRQTKTVVDDSIVVVGRMKQKKRKRLKTSPPTPQGEDASGSANPLPGGGENLEKAVNAGDTTAPEPFDFASEPNILDDVPIAEDSSKPHKKKKQKRQNGGVLEYGDFPAPPRAHREPRGGNQSHTFR